MGCFLKGIGITVIMLLIIGTVSSCNGNDKNNLNKLESYINAKEYVKAEEIIKKLNIKDLSNDDQKRFVDLEVKTYSAVGKDDDTAKSIIAYYKNLKDKSTLDEALNQELNDLKSKTSLETSKQIDSILADLAQVKLAKQQKEAAAKSKDFEKAYRDIVLSRDGDKIATLYNSDLNNDEKSTLSKETDKSYTEWLTSEKRMKYSTKSDIEKIEQKLNFLDKVDDPEFNRLKNVKAQIKELINLKGKEDSISQRYGNNVQIINTNSVESLDIYVASRVQSPYHINVAGIDLNNKYTNQFQITSYRNAGGTSYPTNDWIGVMAFKDSSSVSSGVKNILALHTKDENFVNSQGFEKKLPVYIEVTQDDIDYSKEVNKYSTEEDKVLGDINKLLE
jgi:hypothetical protein